MHHNRDESENVMLSNKPQLKQSSCLYKCQEQAKLSCGKIRKSIASGLGVGGGVGTNIRQINQERVQRTFPFSIRILTEVFYFGWYSHFMGVCFMVYTTVKIIKLNIYYLCILLYENYTSIHKNKKQEGKK